MEEKREVKNRLENKTDKKNTDKKNTDKKKINKKKLIGRLLGLIPIIAWMIVIFNFSAQPGEESSDLSGTFSYVIVEVVGKIFHLGFDKAKILEIAGIIDFPIRKLAHMTEYAILSMITYLYIRISYGIKSAKWCLIIPLVTAFCYASTDEFHQLFVAGRVGCFRDVLIDSSGALLMILFLLLVDGKRRIK